MISAGEEIKYIFQMPDFMVAYYAQQLKHPSLIISSCTEVTNKLIEKGVSKDKVLEYGVPIAEKFYQEADRKNLLEELCTSGE